jgi:hypothetical protein
MPAEYLGADMFVSREKATSRKCVLAAFSPANTCFILATVVGVFTSTNAPNIGDQALTSANDLWFVLTPPGYNAVPS